MVKLVIQNWLVMGIGVTLGLSILCWKSMKKAGFVRSTISICLTILFWPIAMWDNLKE